jgi:hypothetical protein
MFFKSPDCRTASIWITFCWHFLQFTTCNLKGISDHEHILCCEVVHKVGPMHVKYIFFKKSICLISWQALGRYHMVVGFSTTCAISAYHQVCQWPAAGQWFSPCIPVSSTNKTDRHDITEILLKVALNTINQNWIAAILKTFLHVTTWK